MRQIKKKYKNSTAVASKLANDNVNIVYRVLYDRFKGMAHDALISIGMTSLMDAAYKYDTSSNVKFTTYAYSVIYFTLLEGLKKEKAYTDSRLLCGDFSDEEELTKEIREFLSKYKNRDTIDIDFDGLQVLTDLGLYEMGWEMHHQELKGGGNVKPRDYKQQKVVRRDGNK